MQFGSGCEDFGLKRNSFGKNWIWNSRLLKRSGGQGTVMSDRLCRKTSDSPRTLNDNSAREERKVMR